MHFALLPAPHYHIIGGKVDFELEEHIHCAVIIQTSIEVIPENIVGCILGNSVIQTRVTQYLDLLAEMRGINFPILRFPLRLDRML